MSGLFSIMRTGISSLNNFQRGLAVVNDNVANAGTPGFTKKRAVFEPSMSIRFPFGALGTGAQISQIEGLRDPFAERRLVFETQNQGFFKGQQFGLQEIEATFFFSTAEGNLGDQISRFFNSFSELTSDPASITLRENVLAEARTLATKFNDASRRLGRLALDNRQRIGDQVEEINSLTERLAKLNTETATFTNQGIDGGNIEDERNQVLQDLSELVDFQFFSDEKGFVNVITASGESLVLGGKSFQLDAVETASGVDIEIGGRNVTTDLLQGGELGGFLTLDRQTIPSFLAELDLLAEQIAIEVNAVHATGEDLNNNPGAALFAFTPGGAAGTLSVAISDPVEIAAGAVGAGPGDASVAQQIVNLRDQSFAALGNDSFQGFFSQVVFRSGLESRDVTDSLQTQSTIVSQIQQQRDSVSGVSLDEEAVALIQLQRSFEAGARVIQVADQLLEETMNLVR